MNVNIEILNFRNQVDLLKMRLSLGEISVTSPPGSIFDHYTDLKSNRFFLEQHKLASFFSREEPLVNFTYNADSSMSAYIYSKSQNQISKLQHKFSLDDLLFVIDKAIAHLNRLSNYSTKYALDYEQQFKNDLSAGVFDVYLISGYGDGVDGALMGF